MFNLTDFLGLDMDTVHVEKVKFQAFVVDQEQKDSRFFSNSKLSVLGLDSLFFKEVFAFWLAPLTVSSHCKEDFIKFAKKAGMPVIDYDKEDLSWLGSDLFTIWNGSIASRVR